LTSLPNSVFAGFGFANDFRIRFKEADQLQAKKFSTEIGQGIKQAR